MARLGDICKFQSGGTPSKNNPLYFDGTIPWITTVALNGNIIDENNAVDWITEKALAESAAKIVPANSIMVGTRVGIGKVAINSVPMSTSQDIISLLEVDESKWNKAFLCKWLSARSNYLQTQARGATIKGIKIETLANLEIPEIPIERQLFITTCLDRVFKLISLRKQQLAKLDELVKARFVEMFGDPVKNPLGWETVILSDLGSCKNGMNFHADDSGIEIHCLGVGDFKDLSAISDVNKLSVVSLTEMPSDDYLLQDDDIVFVRSNGNKALVGRSLAIYPGNIPTTFSGFCIRFRLNSKIVLTNYLLMVLKTDSIRKKMAGRGANIQNLNQQILSELVIPVPPLQLQQQFSNFNKQVNEFRLTIQQSRDKLEVLKKSLMQEYFG